jgi:N-acetyl-anhydromuramyl-L-alanine amidase AmpD
MKIIGKGFNLEEFSRYLDGVSFGSWKPRSIVIHHCAAPSLAQRPNGFISQHMLNLQDFYEGKGWSAGPHLFIDEDQAWVFSPLNQRGVHAVSFNATSIGIEMLGDYDSEDPTSGRGAQVLAMTARVTELLMKKLGIKKDGILFHRDDPKTSKTCPGKKIKKDWFLNLIK